MPVVLGAVTRAADSMFGPPGAEVGVLHREVPDELSQSGVLDIDTGIHAKRTYGLARIVSPLQVHRAQARIREQQPDVVAALGWYLREVEVEGRSGRVPRQDVQPPAHARCRRNRAHRRSPWQG